MKLAFDSWLLRFAVEVGRSTDVVDTDVFVNNTGLTTEPAEEHDMYEHNYEWADDRFGFRPQDRQGA